MELRYRSIDNETGCSGKNAMTLHEKSHEIYALECRLYRLFELLVVSSYLTEIHSKTMKLLITRFTSESFVTNLIFLAVVMLMLFIQLRV